MPKVFAMILMAKTALLWRKFIIVISMAMVRIVI